MVENEVEFARATEALAEEVAREAAGARDEVMAASPHRVAVDAAWAELVARFEEVCDLFGVSAAANIEHLERALASKGVGALDISSGLPR